MMHIFFFAKKKRYHLGTAIKFNWINSMIKVIWAAYWSLNIIGGERACALTTNFSLKQDIYTCYHKKMLCMDKGEYFFDCKFTTDENLDFFLLVYQSNF